MTHTPPLADVKTPQSNASKAGPEPLAGVIKELRELLDKATPGPWVADYTNLYDQENCQDIMTSSCCCGNGRMRERHDASLVAATVNHLPQLLTAAEKAGALQLRVLELEEENKDSDRVIGTLSNILNNTAINLKGQPIPPVSLHSFHDIAEVALEWKEKAERYERALRFYADFKKNRDKNGAYVIDEFENVRWDRGETARQALAPEHGRS